MRQPSPVLLQKVDNLSACGQVVSEALERCLRGKSEEEMLDIIKVRLNVLRCGGSGLMVCVRRSPYCSGLVVFSPSLGVLTALNEK